MEIRLLGTFEVVHDGRRVALGGLRQRAVLAALCLRANEVVSFDRLVDDVWGDEPPASVATTLRGYLSHLRRALADAPVRVEGRRPGYMLGVDPWSIDIVRFDHLVEEGRAALTAGDGPSASTRLRAALELWRGPALADFAYEPFATSTITRLEEQRLVAVELRIDADLLSGRAAELVGELRALVAEHPLREASRAQLMRALHAAGRRAAALEVYQEGRRRLIDELGLEPSPALQALEQAILLDDVTRIEPAVPAQRPASGNLPAAVTSFIGRKQEMSQVGALLDANRLVTLTGTGGSGKTRLALEVGAALVPRRSDGVWLVELAAVTSADRILDAFASALHVSRGPETPLLDAVIAALAPTSATLIVDNCEHVRDDVSHVLFAILQRCPNVRVLATSREPLGIPGEVLWKVPSLPVPEPEPRPALDDALDFDAVRLFVERAASAAPGFRVDDDHIPSIVEIVRRLDGIPLALELAAGRLQALSIEQVASLLDDRFRLLTSNSAVILPRHRTLRAVVDFSYDLLDDQEQLLFARLAVFAGEFDLELAEDVCAGGALARTDVMDLLARLVARSLVSRIDGAHGLARYRLLETLRAYAAERLHATTEEQAVRRRHATVCVERVERAAANAYGPEPAFWLRQVETLYDDHESALDWLLRERDALALRLAVALWPFWNARFSVAQGRLWLSRCLEMDGAPPHERAAALAATADLAFWDDDFDAAREACDEGLALAAASGDDLTRSLLLRISAELARESDDGASAETLARDSLRLATRAGAIHRQGEALKVLAMVVADRGDLLEAEALAEESAARAREAGNVVGMAEAIGTLGSLAHARGDAARAMGLFEQCLQHFRAAEEVWSEARAIARLGAVALAQGDPRRAYELGAESLGIYERLRSTEGIAESLLVMSEAARMRDDVEQAALLASAALERCRERGFSGHLMWALVAAGAVELRRDQLLTADALLAEAKELFERGQTRHAAVAVLLLGVTRARLRRNDAHDLCHRSLELFQEMGDQRGAARSLLGLAEAALAAEEPLAALRYLSAARATGRVNELRAIDHEVGDYLDLLRRVRALVPSEQFDAVWAVAPSDETEVGTTVDPQRAQ